MNATKPSLRIQPWTAVFLCFVQTLLAAIALGQSTQPVPIPTPPEAIQSVNKGILAARQQDYLLAIRYFQDARGKALLPEIFANLGLAESGLPGRELRAICWFEAYLSADPLAPNSAVVRQQINALDVKSQANLSRLIKLLEDDVPNLPAANQQADLSDVALLWATAGDLPSATRIAGLIQDAAYQSRSWQAIAYAQTVAGDLAGAQKSAALIQDPLDRSRALQAIGSMQADGGDDDAATQTFLTAQAAIDIIQQPTIKDNAETDLAFAEGNAGHLREAQNAAGQIKNPAIKKSVLGRIGLVDGADMRTDNWRRFADKQAAAGDASSARDTLTVAARSDAAMIPSDSERCYRLLEIAHAEGEIKDFTDAQDTLVAAQESADQIVPPTQRLRDQQNVDITEAQIRAFALAAAPADSAPSSLLIRPATAVWLARLDDDNSHPVNSDYLRGDDCPLNTELFLDLPHYLHSLPPSDAPQKLFSTQSAVAWQLARAQNAIEQMLKMSAGN